METTFSTARLTLEAKHADEMAYCLLPKGDEAPDAATIFSTGRVLDVPAEPYPIFYQQLEAGASYTFYAAARRGDTCSQLGSADVTLPAQLPMLSFVSSTKTGFSYRIENIEQDRVFFHTYLEKWAYDELRAMYEEAQGADFDRDLMLRDALADYGLEATGPQTLTWEGGDDNPPREGPALIVGGKTYYALASMFDPQVPEWVGKPEIVEFTTEQAGKSPATVDIYVDELTSEELVSRIEPDPTIRYYFYHLFPKAVVDAYVAEFGQEAFENYIYENGWASDGAYTDRWRFSVPGDTYLLAVFGIDRNGDTMYTDRVIDAPDMQPDVTLVVQPYEDELQGYYEYQSLEVTVVPQLFDVIPVEQMQWGLYPKEVIDATLEMAGGATLEECVAGGYLMMQPLAEEWAGELTTTGRFTYWFNDLDEQTEYYFIVLLPDPSGEEIMVRYAAATTAARPADAPTPDAEYQAALGSWTLSGRSTEDWDSPLTYHFTVEQLTPNRSYLVRGWSLSAVGQEKPFVMNYDPATKKIFIRAPQRLGTYTDNGVDYEAMFVGLFVGGFTDDLSILFGPAYIAYIGSVDGDVMRLFPEMFTYDGKQQDFRSMGYTGRKADGTFHAFEGDEYNPVYFAINRAADATASAMRRPVAADRKSVV